MYDSGDPSVNHLIVVADGPGLAHDFTTNTDSDFHRARGLASTRRIYYLLYSREFGGHISDPQTIAILNAFLGAIRVSPPWLSAAPQTGTTIAGGTTNVTLGFDATDLEAGDYFGNLLVSSNDPIHSEITLPVQLHVVGRPVLALNASELDLGNVFIGYSGARQVEAINLGSEPLVVSGMSSDRPDFSASPSAFTLAPHESTIVTVTFSPHSAGQQNASLTIASNDPESPETLSLIGNGVPPPHLSLDQTAIEKTAPPGGSRTATLHICNTGGSPLSFDGRLIEVDTAPEAPALGASSNGPASAMSPLSVRQQGTIDPLYVPGTRAEGRISPRVDASGGPDAFGYRWIDSDAAGGPVYQWIDIRGIGTEVGFGGSADDLTVGPYPIGFDFPFYGGSFGTFNVSSNGFISFSSLSSSSANTALPSGELVPENLVAAFWDDLAVIPSYGGKVLYHSDGNRLVVQFVRVARFGDVGFLDFEIILHRNGRIVYQYQTLGSTKTSATVGIQNAERTIGLTTAYNTSYLHDGLAIEYIGAPDWIALEPRTGVVPAGECVDVEVRLDAGSLEGRGLRGAAAARDRRSGAAAHHARCVVPRAGRRGRRTPDQSQEDQHRRSQEAGQGQARAIRPLQRNRRRDLDRAFERRGSRRSNAQPPRARGHSSAPHLTIEFDRAAVVAILPPGDSVRVEVTGEFTDERSFTATTYVTVKRPHVHAPNGGELLSAGSSAPVSWTVDPEVPATYANLLWSSDGGAHWTLARSQLTGTSTNWTVPNVATLHGRVRVEQYDVDGLLAYDESDADFAVSAATAALGDESAQPIRAVALRQNAPNPFRDGTSIGFDLPREATVRLRVFDMAGRTVRVLADGMWPLGRHEIAWNGRDGRGNPLPPGIYLYRFESGSFSATKRLVMLE